MERKNTTINSTQKDMLIQFLKSNPNLQTGKFSNTFTFKNAQSLWEEISDYLNSVPNGAQKEWRQWRKTWQDLKKHTKSKAVSVKKHMTGTGGGEQAKPLSDAETEILGIMSPTQIEGMSIEEIPITFNFDTENIMDQSQQNEVVDVDLGREEVLESEKPSVSEVYDHEYANVTSATPKKINKTTRLTKSLDISNNLLKSVDKRNSLLDEYYTEKIKYYKAKSLYFNQNLDLKRKILNDLKDILTNLVKK